MVCTFVQQSEKHIDEFYKTVVDVAEEARRCYVKDGSLELDDMTEFTKMMFLDGCFVIKFMHYLLHDHENLKMTSHVAALAISNLRSSLQQRMIIAGASQPVNTMSETHLSEIRVDPLINKEEEIETETSWTLTLLLRNPTLTLLSWNPKALSLLLQFSSYLSNDLLSIVDGTETCPSKFLVDSNGKPTLELDPKFTLWTKKDQYLLSWLNATLSETILPTVFGLNTSKEVWDLLSNRFAAQNRSRITHLKRQLQNLQQGNKSCTEYIQSAKGWANQLAAVGKSIDDDDLISYIISGLNTAYTPFITSFSFATRHTSLSFNEFQSELISYETLLETQIKSVPPEAG
ncbi:hypothetical protein DKX38_023300 [Salix brachista]|uniref:Retrotransposon gag domain-containing protein n=1 Tax=Salix brachista TaxID=2182728 RepID=A0A5N5JIL9_9ROSI|nr:hypothetical protein DKX38_023300 [Salix brachista]